MSGYRDAEGEQTIRTLVEYCDTHPELGVSARGLVQVLLDVEEILDAKHSTPRYLKELLDAMDRLSDTGNE